MGDARFGGPYARVRDALDRFRVLVSLDDDEVIQALAHASREHDPMLANVLATEALNRLRRSRIAFHHLGAGLIAVDAAGRLTSVNPAACKLLGAAREELLGRAFRETIQPVTEGAVATDGAVLRALELGAVVEADSERFTRRDGATFVAAVIAAPIVEDGDVSGVVATFLDITARRDAEARHAAVIDASLDAIITIDDAGLIREFNAAAERILGHARESVVGQRLADVLVPPEFRAAHVAGIARATTGGEPQILGRRIRVPALRADGSTIPVELAITRLPGLPIRFTGFLRDLTEEVAARASAHEASDRYAQMVNRSPLSTQIFSPDGTTIATNPAWERLWGVTLEQLGGYNVLKDPQLEKKGVTVQLRRAFAGETVYIPPVLYDPAEDGIPLGRARWVEAHAYPLLDSAGRVDAVVLIHDDVTDRVEAGRRTAMTQTQAQLLLENVYDFAICMLDPEGRVVSWNVGSERLNGYSADEILGQHLRVFHTPEDQARRTPERGLEEAARLGTFHEEGWLLRKSGERYWAATTLTAIRTDGRLAGFAKVVRDLTERHLAEERTREQERMYRDLVENSPEPMGVHAGGILLFINPAGARLLGARSPEELLGRKVMDFVAPESRPLVLGRLKAMSESSELLPPAEERLVRVDGTTIDVETVALPIRYDRKPAVQLILRDITHRKLAEASLRRFNVELEQRVNERTRQLQQAIRDLETFTNSASHDLRAPLRGLAALALDLKRATGQADAGAIRELTELILHETDKANRLVHDLLTFAKSGQSEIVPTLVDVTAVANKIIADIAAQHPERATRWRVQPEMRAFADLALFRIALQNLLDNASKYSQRSPDAIVEISAHADAAGTTLRVADNGVGFSQAEAARLFAPFHRLSTAQGYEGTGLGLASVHRIITRHGGAIRAESEPGRGAAFIVQLPHPARKPSGSAGPAESA